LLVQKFSVINPSKLHQMAESMTSAVVSVRNTFIEVVPRADHSVGGSCLRQRSAPARGPETLLTESVYETSSDASSDFFGECLAAESHAPCEFNKLSWADISEEDASTSAGSSFPSMEDLPPMQTEENGRADDMARTSPGTPTLVKPACCPSCGVRVVLTFRFCPCCCFSLHQAVPTMQPMQCSPLRRSPAAPPSRRVPQAAARVPQVATGSGVGSLCDNLERLKAYEPKTCLVVRRIKPLGLGCVSLLRKHFAKYGEVAEVLISQSSDKRLKRPLSAAMGFVVMSSVNGAATALRAGPTIAIGDVDVNVQVFEPFEGLQ